MAMITTAAPVPLHFDNAFVRELPADGESGPRLPEVGSAQVEVFDVRGRLVRSLDVVAVGDSGVRASWDGKDGTGRRVSGGIYFAAVRSAGRTDIARLILIE